ncbi:glycoside hydrolase family 3 C-terminal domain-containing protein [Nocardiopsis sp. HNM0947]|uniref:Glycoside hydrolase family 3 C-terminal domain-containing protein n=1 Tax=Nocardiopsis coralli TaxID=2772213 RepID=A0ABR9P6G4_9ACTN|nr:glycoside hydrolase family 3 C-terminal domain-containing protein [Nocardiopsis coralli]MBE2999433.1 glycoside hydrolase family 3 C-terminal domain-containing protein [Nocardiopsis coralli]
MSAPNDPRTDRAQRVEQALNALDLEGKVRLLSGDSMWALPADPAIGLGRLVMSDGPVGVRGEHWSPDDPSVQLPSPTAIAATWDRALVRRVGHLLAQEAHRKGVHVLLAPAVNMHRSPLGGRHFETFSEDPYLTGEIGSAYVQGVQDGGVGTTVKHYVANDSETDRFTVDVRADERTLREIYLAPFEHIVNRARPWGVMSAYNRVNGTTMTEHTDLNAVLREEWGFDGFIVSDWTAARDTVADALAGLDVAMPGPNTVYGHHLIDAVRDGRVPEEAVDALARRVLLLASRVGLLEGTPPAVPHADRPAPLDGRAVARETASRSFVLLRNNDRALPIDTARTRRIALIGLAASEARTSGGGSASVFAERTVTPLEGLREALPEDVELTYAVGADPRAALPAVATPLTATFHSTDGRVLGTDPLSDGTARWIGELPDGVTMGELDRIEVEGTLVPETTGEHLVGVTGAGTYTLTVDGRTVFEGELAFEGDDPAAAMFDPPATTHPVHLTAGEPVRLSVVREDAAKNVGGDFAFIGFNLTHREPMPDGDTLIEEAVEAARGADTAVVLVATTAEVESEGFDRASLALPGRQDELVARVAEANGNTVAVVNAGSPVEMPWRGDVSSILLTWFGGQELGGALADVLLGHHDPSGRLPTTWPAREADVPVLSVTPEDGALDYAEGVHVGYRGWERADAEPAFGFGHGLSYTQWRYDSAEASPAEPGETDADGLPVLATVRVRVTNTGERSGREVVQVYLAPHEPGDRPARTLAGFATVTAAAGESAEAVVTLPREAVRTWAADADEWEYVPGGYDLHVGRSLHDTRLTEQIRVA